MIVNKIKKLCDDKKTTPNGKKLNLAELERELGFGNGTIAKWDKSSPTVDKLEKVSYYFGITLDYILTGQEPLPKNLAPDEAELVQLYRKLEPVKQVEYRSELKGYVKAKEESKAN